MTERKLRNLKQTDRGIYFDFTFRGIRHRGFAGWNREQARNTVVKMRAELLDIARGFKKPTPDGTSFDRFADDFLELYSRPNKRSADRDEDSLQHLRRFFSGKALADIQARDIAAYMAARRAEAKPATCNREFSTLRTLLEKAVEWGKIEINPALRIKRFKEPEGQRRILTRQEGDRLLEAASPDTRTFLTIALGTAARRGEILGLAWKDLDFTTGMITLTKTKAGKDRRIPMSGAVAEALSRIPRKGEYLFRGQPGWSTTTVKKGFTEACRAAEITGLRIHDLRHTALTWLIEDRVDVRTVQAIAGHASLEMTARYLHTDEGKKREAVQALGARIDGQTRQNLRNDGSIEIPAPALNDRARDN